MKGKQFLARKIHSLVGVVPLGAFLVVHAVTNFQAFERGPEGFDKGVGFINGMPLIMLLEVFGIYLPLIFHAVYGLYLAYRSNSNTGSFNYGRNWAFTMQRVTGVLTFMFVIWHVYQTRLQVYLGNVTHEGLGSTMNYISSNPVYFVLYLIGVVAAVYHFSNGLWAFMVSWGITVGPRAQRVSAIICMGVFVVMAALFVLALIAFRGEEFAEAAAILSTIKNIG